MPVSDHRDVLSYYSNFLAPRDTRADYAQGELDGQSNRPRSVETSLSGYELDIVNQARADVSRFRLHLHIDQHGSSATIIARRQLRYEEYESDLRDLSQRHDSRVSVANKECGPGSSLAKRQQEALFEAEHGYNDLQRELGREPELHWAQPLPFLRLSAYTLILIAMSFVELFINKGVFKAVLGGLVPGYSGAFIMGLAIVFFAHLLGIFVRQRKIQRRPMEKLRTWVGIPLIIVLVLFIVYEMSLLRADTLPLGMAASEMDGGSVLGLSHTAFLLFLLNLGVFVAGTWLSYMRHDPHPDYERLLVRMGQAQQLEAERRDKFDLLLAEIEEEYRRKRSNLAARADRIQREIDEDLAHADGLPSREEAEIQKVIAVVSQRVLAYQSGNERSRDAARPRYFGQPTVLMIDALIRGDLSASMSDRDPIHAFSE